MSESSKFQHHSLSLRTISGQEDRPVGFEGPVVMVSVSLRRTMSALDFAVSHVSGLVRVINESATLELELRNSM